MVKLLFAKGLSFVLYTFLSNYLSAISFMIQPAALRDILPNKNKPKSKIALLNNFYKVMEKLMLNPKHTANIIA